MIFEPNDLVEFSAKVAEAPTPENPVPPFLSTTCRGRVSRVCMGHVHVIVMHLGQPVAEWAMRDDWVRKVKPGS
jgi:hypothetical protein